MFLIVPGEENEVVEELSFCGGQSPLAPMRRLRGLGEAARGEGGESKAREGQAQLKQENGGN